MSRHSLAEALTRSIPLNVSEPELMYAPRRCKVPTKERHSIVFPEPDSPISPSSCPGSTSNVALFTIVNLRVRVTLTSIHSESI